MKKLYFTVIMHDVREPFDLKVVKEAKASVAEFDIDVDERVEGEEELFRALGEKVFRTLHEKNEQSGRNKEAGTQSVQNNGRQSV